MKKAMYVHVPFCNDICAYCDFTRCGYFAPLADRWLNRIEQELREKQIDPLTTLYIGGGTPSALQPYQLEKLLKLLAPYAQTVEEYTIEANADSLDDTKIDILKTYGINRVSMGAQTFQSELLALIKRKADYASIKDRIEHLHKAGITNISLDLMYGLPTQTKAMWSEDLQLAVQLPISHISLYALTIEEHSEFGRMGIQPCEGDLEADLYEIAIRTLCAHGFTHYEISNFAKPEKASLHNQMYWHYEDFYGIGCGASGKEGKVRYDNTRNLHTYLTQGPCPDPLVLSREDRMFEMLMMNLRLREGICEQHFQDRFHVTLQEAYGSAIEKNMKDQLLVYEHGYLHTTKRGMLLLNEVLLDFLPG